MKDRKPTLSIKKQSNSSMLTSGHRQYKVKTSIERRYTLNGKPVNTRNLILDATQDTQKLVQTLVPDTTDSQTERDANHGQASRAPTVPR